MAESRPAGYSSTIERTRAILLKLEIKSASRVRIKLSLKYPSAAVVCDTFACAKGRRHSYYLGPARFLQLEARSSAATVGDLLCRLLLTWFLACQPPKLTSMKQIHIASVIGIRDGCSALDSSICAYAVVALDGHRR